ncbi:hypothetical protein A2V55_00005, partial [Candidatus Woesebacteria bacterium RBG_19FT_COMBO_37_29]
MRQFNRDNRFGGGRRDFGRRDFGGRGRDREMFKTICSNCGKECEVPFKPTGSKPVYCSDCFEKMGGGSDSRRFDDRSPRRSNFENRDSVQPQSNFQFDAINAKLDKILGILSPVIPPVVEEKKEIEIEIKEVKAEPKKKSKTSKKSK